MKKKNSGFVVVGFIFMILIGVFVSGFSWQGSDVIYNVSEDGLYIHDLSANITGFNDDVVFAIDTDVDIFWTNVSGKHNVTKEDVSGWISILNSSTGNLSIDVISDNQTGFFEILIQGINGSSSSGETFQFMINATNDAPLFSNLDSSYNITQDIEFFEYLNATDEEEHYPLFFNISFLDNCTHASWSGRSSNENCSIFNLTEVYNVSASMNFTSSRNDVGVYWANVSVTDFSVDCSSGYCSSDYLNNKTNWTIVRFDVFSSLGINVTNCTNSIVQENEEFICYINVSTRGDQDELNLSSVAFLRNYEEGQDYVSNKSWFYANASESATGFMKTIMVNVTPQKQEVGNWTINFSVYDVDSGENEVAEIYIYVNKTIDAFPLLNEVSDHTFYENSTIDVNATDRDLLIPDKNSVFGGYNETLVFLSNTSWVNIFTYVSIPNVNWTTARMSVNHDLAVSLGLNNTNQTIKINVTDIESNFAERIFVLEILDDTPASWNQSEYSFVFYENNETYINLSKYVSDAENDTLIFSAVSDTDFLSFDLTSSGIINFTSIDEDVGQHLVSVNASDGKMDSIVVFNFSVYNVNDIPIIETPLLVNTGNTTCDADSNITTSEDNLTIIYLYINDNDVKIPASQVDEGFYNESLDVNWTIQGPNNSLFDFSFSNVVVNSGLWVYKASFLPSKSDVGSYNVTVNVTDNGNSTVGGAGSDDFSFKILILSKEHNPVLSDLENKTSAINRSFYFRINATDSEDGDSTENGNANFSFNISFLEGDDFINFNETIFNTTTGVLNMDFNSSQDGIYHLNVSANDSSGKLDYKDFWINVYGLPNITFPLSSHSFVGLYENVSLNLTFRANHSVGDNLTYLFYVDNIVYNSTNFTYSNFSLRLNQTYYGNDTNLTWLFSPNFTDESYGKFKNLSLVVYPSSSNLENASDLNYSLTWDINVSYNNSPVGFFEDIGDKQDIYGRNIEIDLSSYFEDVDYVDGYYNQVVNFTVSGEGSLSYSLSDWILSFSSTGVDERDIIINASDWDNNSVRLTSVISNEFKVKFIAPVEIEVPTSSSSSTKPVSLKIIMPAPVSVYKKDKIIIPLVLLNTGRTGLSRINLSSLISINNSVSKDVSLSFDKSYFNSLGVGDRENVSLVVDINTEVLGDYEITVNASVGSPKYEDWAKMYLTIKEANKTEVLERVLFIEEFIAENPECIELKEMIDDAKDSLDKGDYSNSLKKARDAIDACKYAIAQQALPKEKEKVEDKIYRYLTIFTLAAFVLGISHYAYQKRKLRRVALR